MTYIQAKKLEKRWNSFITRSRKAYERNDALKENYWSNKLEHEAKGLNVTVDWPGLYPCYLFNDKGYYDTESLINAIMEASK